MKQTQNNSFDSQQVLSVIEQYSTALDLLDAYDHQTMERPKGNEAAYVLTYEECMHVIAWLGNEDICISGDAFIYHHHEDAKYISYLLQTECFQTQKKPFVTGTKVMRISKESLAKIKIPVPPLSEQRRIVAILDKFEALVNDLTEGLPAEIAARQEQYEYYRDKLLSFPKAV